MIDEKTGGPAFPTKTNFHRLHGMTLRDYFAAKAMQAIVQEYFKKDQILPSRKIATFAYDIADEMMEERK